MSTTHLDLPAGVALVTIRSGGGHFRGGCCRCGEIVDTTLVEHLVASVLLDTWAGPQDRVICLCCWQFGGRFIVEGAAVRGWVCYCCTCPEFRRNYRCREHGEHGVSACDVHRQPATTCNDDCCTPGGAA